MVVQRVEMPPKQQKKVANEVLHRYHFKGAGIIIFERIPSPKVRQAADSHILKLKLSNIFRLFIFLPLKMPLHCITLAHLCVITSSGGKYCN